MPQVKRARKDIARVRSGCRTCRDRKVKCSEEKPTCRHCARLGHQCIYYFRLAWQKPIPTPGRQTQRCGLEDFDEPCSPGSDVALISSWAQSPAAPSSGTQRYMQSWMFVNLSAEDFAECQLPEDPETNVTTHVLKMPPPILSTISSIDFEGVHLTLARDHFEDSFSKEAEDIGTAIRTSAFDCRHARFLLSPENIPRHISSIALSPTEWYLLEYFSKVLTQQCALVETQNPYCTLMLRIALVEVEQPLLQILLAVSANQLRRLGHHNFDLVTWKYRAKVLAALRSNPWVTKQVRTSAPHEWEQLLATLIMLCFFDISDDCSNSWIAHSSFACSIPRPSEPSVMQDKLWNFACRYFRSHFVFAQTAWSSHAIRAISTWPPSTTADLDGISLYGCADELLDIIQELSLMAAVSCAPGGCSLPSERTGKRNQVERRLISVRQVPDHDEPATVHEETLHLVAEIKRLCALLYLYGRVDMCSPSHILVIRLTEKILDLIPQISLRTHVLLWPLFIVGTLGVRPERDQDRKLVMGTLSALQETRQLGNVKKVRQIVEEVWKRRDLGDGAFDLNWDFLFTKYSNISLV